MRYHYYQLSAIDFLMYKSQAMDCATPYRRNMVVVVKQVAAVGTHTILEAPHWDIERQCLYFTDILAGKIFRYDYRQDKVYAATIEGKPNTKIGFIVPVHGKSDQFIIGAGARLLLIQWDGVSPTVSVLAVHAEVDQKIRTTRFNDGKVDPQGRIFAGTMESEEHGDIFTKRNGGFYKFDKGVVTQLKTKVNISNGLAWNEKTNKFYFIDTGDLNLKEYDYESGTGKISNEKIILTVLKDSYFLDGMTIDDQGFLYVATFLGGRVLKVDSKGKIVQEISIPNAQQVTSAAFGGPNLDELFVTTGAVPNTAGPHGGLFKITGLGVKGLKMHAAKI